MDVQVDDWMNRYGVKGWLGEQKKGWMIDRRLDG